MEIIVANRDGFGICREELGNIVYNLSDDDLWPWPTFEAYRRRNIKLQHCRFSNLLDLPVLCGITVFVIIMQVLMVRMYHCQC
jgi:hypothetical protein